LRLFLAGAAERNQSIFSESALKLVHYYSNGIPRLVNTICEAALIASFALKRPIVAAELIDEIAADFCLIPSAKFSVKSDVTVGQEVAAGTAMNLDRHSTAV
jgi:hypothetical protein